MIKPTVGRIVNYWPSHLDLEPIPVPFTYYPGSHPCAAQIAFVWSDTCVNLSIVDHAGVLHSRTSVPLYHGDGPRPVGAYCEWMDYQKGQAAKAEQLEAKVATLEMKPGT